MPLCPVKINVDKFRTFLIQSGAEIIETKNQYEVIRFKTINGLSIVYQGRRGFSFVGDASDAYRHFINKKNWSIISSDQKAKYKIKRELIERDGPHCFYCGYETYLETTAKDRFMTIEHVLSKVHGGNDNINNLVISCSKCNAAVGHMSIVDKIKYKDNLYEESLG